MIENDQKPVSIIMGMTLLGLLAAYLYSAKMILSPILIGGILIFVMNSMKQNPVIQRLIISIWVSLTLWIFIRAQSVFFPLIVAYTIAYLLDPVADFLEQKRWPRSLASILLILIVIALVTLIGIILIPNLVQELQQFIVSLPQVAEKVARDVNHSLKDILAKLRIDPAIITNKLSETIPKGLQQIFSNVLKSILSVGSFIGQLVNVIIIPVLTFYILKDFNKIREWFLSLFPKKKRPRVSYYLWRSNRILGGYVRGQILVSTIVGILTGGLFAILGVPFAVLLGMITGVLNVIPFIGLYVSLAIAVLVAFLEPNVWITLLKVGGVFIVVQGVEGAVINPKVLGDRVGLHPVAVVFSVLLFAKFMGFWGLVIGLPVAAFVMFLLDERNRKEALKDLVEEESLRAE